MESGVKVRLKAMALRSNVHEMDEIAAFCRRAPRTIFRFDPQLHLRFDGDPRRNAEIRQERLTPAEVVALERADEQRFGALQESCDATSSTTSSRTSAATTSSTAARATAASTSGYDGTFRLCSSLWAPGTTVNLRQTPLREAWETLVPRVRDLRSQDARIPGDLPAVPHRQPVPALPRPRPPGNGGDGRGDALLLRGRPRAGGEPASIGLPTQAQDGVDVVAAQA